MELSLFDLHCDTAYEMYRRQLYLENSALAVSLSGALCYTRYVQVMAHWTPPTVPDKDGWSHLLSVHQHLLNDPAVKSGAVRIARERLLTANTSPTLLLSLEDARILDGDAAKIPLLSDMGFCIVTPLWRGCSCIGGAHDTPKGLTEFGRNALAKMLSYGILLDVSHASEASFDEILELCRQSTLPPLATHSNAYELCPVSRNLRPTQIHRLLTQNGLIGMNLYTDFLTADGNATLKHVLAHVEYFAKMGAIDSLCLGCDLDGAQPPNELSTLSSLSAIAEALLHQNYSEAHVRGLFYENAFRFAQMYIHKPTKA